jgi:hypothetical protein
MTMKLKPLVFYHDAELEGGRWGIKAPIRSKYAHFESYRLLSTINHHAEYFKIICKSYIIEIIV